MKDKRIKLIWIIFIVTISSLLLLQAVWLYNAYNTKEKEIKDTLNKTLVQSIEKELNIRFIKSDEICKQKISNGDTIPTFDYKFDNDKIEENGVISQQAYAIQKLMAYHELFFNLQNLDSIYDAALNKQNISAKYTIQYSDSTHVIQTTGAASFKGTYHTPIYPIVNGTTVQAFINIPMPLVFKQNIWILSLSSVLLLLLLCCLFYGLRTIITQQSLLRLRNDFTNALTHNMKTPLGAIIVVLDQWQKGKLDNNEKLRNEFAKTAMEEANGLLSIVNRILTISNSEKDKLVLNMSNVNVPDIINELVAKYSLPKKDKKVIFSTAFDITQPVMADQFHLANAISNLIDNSIKYSGNEVNIHIDCRTNDNGLSISVKDNGFGISEENIQHIFNKFERGDAVKRNGAKGFGLGLNYVKHIAEAHHGHVSVTSSKNKGSEFVIWIK